MSATSDDDDRKTGVLPQRGVGLLASIQLSSVTSLRQSLSSLQSTGELDCKICWGRRPLVFGKVRTRP